MIKKSTKKAKINKNNLPLYPKRTLRSKLMATLLIIFSVICIFLLILPYLPRLQFLIFKPKISDTPYKEAAKQTRSGRPVSKTGSETLKGNRLVLPSIGVNTEIIEGKNINVISKNQGVLRETPNVNPTVEGNMVIVGHRFLYTAKNGGYFYNLPELKINDTFFVDWKDKVYEYQVYNTKTVFPSQVDIRNNDQLVPKKITLYTCYPLGSTAKRFVVEAKQL